MEIYKLREVRYLFQNQLKASTVVGPNKGTQIREFFPYLGQNSENLQIRECPKFPYLIKNSVKNW